MHTLKQIVCRAILLLHILVWQLTMADLLTNSTLVRLPGHNLTEET